MSTETQPSEHAMRAASILDGNLYISDRARLANQRVMASAIDQHAIAPAVAERDRRIAELVLALKAVVTQLRHAHWMAERGNGPAMLSPDVIVRAEQIIATHGGAHE